MSESLQDKPKAMAGKAFMLISKSKFREIVATVLPSRFMSYRDYLAASYEALKASLESYSWVQFAEDLGFPKGNAIHLVMRGKRRLTSRATARIVAAFDLRNVERQYFETLVELNNAKTAPDREIALARLEGLKARELVEGARHKLADKQLRYFSEWFHPVVREAFQLADFDPDPEWIAQRIHPRLRVSDVKASLALLKELGLVTTKGKPRLAQTDVVTPDGGSDMAIYLYLKRMSELGAEALMNLPEHRRDISAVTISGSQETIVKIKAEIAAFHDRLLKLSEEDKGRDQILHVNIQLFPFTKER